MKKAVIIGVTGNELANQLWNYASIYAYTLEHKIELSNPSFFEYGEYFNMPAAPNILFKLFFFLPFSNYTKRKTSIKRKIWRKFYKWYSSVVLMLAGNNVAYADEKKPKAHYLPPSSPVSDSVADMKKGNTIYFNGWLFRNPKGLEKYRNEIIKYFSPRKDIGEDVAENIKNLRKKYSGLIGVHIRQGDYRTWRDGKYFMEHGRVREILGEYLKIKGKDEGEVCFVITSDGKINSEVFKGLNVFISRGNAVQDLFLLSKTDTIIGSNSTFGAFASYYGNIPFIVMENGNMDWDYYKDKEKYFENKYSTFVFY